MDKDIINKFKKISKSRQALDDLYKKIEFSEIEAKYYNFRLHTLNKNYRIKEIISLIRNKSKLKFLMFSILKLIFDRKTRFPDRIKMLLYIAIKYNILLNTVDNLIEISNHC